MDPTTFDRLSQILGAAGSRRAALRLLAATALAAVTPASRRAAAQGSCPPGTKLCGGACCPLDYACCPGERSCCAPGLSCCGNGVTCVNPDTHICCDDPCLSGGCPRGSTCCCRGDGLSGGCCPEGQVCREEPFGPPVCVQGEPPPCPDGRPRCGETCCGDGEECDGNGQCVDPCVAAATRETSGRRGRRQRRSQATAELTCPQCGANEFPCLVNGQFSTCCDGTCCYGPDNATVTCCHPDQTCCGGVCCGGNARPDEVCVEAGRCGCATGLITCRGQCLPPCGGGATYDENCNCRCPDDRPVICNETCVAKCPRGKTLDLVTCQCVQRCKKKGRVRCNGACVNLDGDERNCGDCGRTCRADEKCIKGTCVFSQT